eukprot:826858-Prorocentrum_minimum.AAC.1
MLRRATYAPCDAASRGPGLEGRGGGAGVAVYFLHLPYPREDDHAELAEGVADVIARLVQLELAGGEKNRSLHDKISDE